MQFLAFWFIFCVLNNFGFGIDIGLTLVETSWKQALGLVSYVPQPPKSLPLFHFNLSLRSVAEFAVFSRRMLCSSQACCTFPVAHYHSELQKPGLSGGQKRTWKADLRPSAEKNRSINISCDHLQKFLQSDGENPASCLSLHKSTVSSSG